jgi:large subunit ribosomal protein L21
MYAVIASGGKQYRVEQGEILRVEKLPGQVGDTVSFDQVLMFADADNISVGQPLLSNVSVRGHIVEQDRAKKVLIFKFRRRKRYRKTQGHRQSFTAVKVDAIEAA